MKIRQRKDQRAKRLWLRNRLSTLGPKQKSCHGNATHIYSADPSNTNKSKSVRQAYIHTGTHTMPFVSTATALIQPRTHPPIRFGNNFSPTHSPTLVQEQRSCLLTIYIAVCMQLKSYSSLICNDFVTLQYCFFFNLAYSIQA